MARSTSARSERELSAAHHGGGAVGLGGDDADDLELGVERARELDGRGDGGVGFLGGVVGDADPADRLLGAGAVAVRDDRDGARCAVQEPLARAPGGDASQPAAVGGADDDDLGVLGLRDVVQGVRGRAIGRDPDPQAVRGDPVEPIAHVAGSLLGLVGEGVAVEHFGRTARDVVVGKGAGHDDACARGGRERRPKAIASSERGEASTPIRMVLMVGSFVVG